MSKRGNGLTASSYAPLADIPTRLVDAMLSALRDAGIAAYAVPSTGRQAGFGGLRPFAEPTDRLFADAAERDLARNVLQAQLPRFVDDADAPDVSPAAGRRGAAGEGGTAGDGGPADSGPGAGRERDSEATDAAGAADTRDSRGFPELDEDAIFAEIMAAWDDPPAAGSRWPELEDLDEPRAGEGPGSGTGTGPGRGEPQTGRTGVADRPAADPSDDHPATDRPAAAGQGGEDLEPDRSGTDHPAAGHPVRRVVKPAEDGSARTDAGSDTADDDQPRPDDDDEGHYEPPAPPPTPPLDPVTKGAWTALFGGPLYLLAAAMLGWEVPGWSAFAAVAAFVGGFVTLVVRMGDEPRGSGPDDGAVI